MDTQKIAAQFRLSGWGDAVKERIASGQTISAFCKAHGISKNCSLTTEYRQCQKELPLSQIQKREDDGSNEKNSIQSLQGVHKKAII